jgi:hypothetical protein
MKKEGKQKEEKKRGLVVTCRSFWFLLFLFYIEQTAVGCIVLTNLDDVGVFADDVIYSTHIEEQLVNICDVGGLQHDSADTGSQPKRDISMANSNYF